MFGLSRFFTQTAVALFLISGLPIPTYADEVWSVVAKNSHFGPGVNTLVIKRRNGPPGDQDGTEPSRFLVLSHGAIYLAVDEQATLPAGTTIASNYSRWPHMKLIKMGENAVRYYCFRCRDGIAEDSITLKFSATFVDPRAVLTDTLVLNTK